MLTLAAPRVSDRKLRLYLVGCCRRRWELFTDDRCRRAVAIAERYADGRATEAEREHAGVQAREAWEQGSWATPATGDPRRAAGQALLMYTADATIYTCLTRAELLRPQLRLGALQSGDEPPIVARMVALVPRAVGVSGSRNEGGGQERYDAVVAYERAAEADLLRCVFGDPFVYTVPDPAWRTAAAVGLAEAIYAGRAFDRLPILADALEEAGCDDPAVLAHCRRDREHARGCWVVDMLLDKS
jgi:hypothetical protein